MENFSKIIQYVLERYRSLTKVGKCISVIGICALIASLLLFSSCGTIGWISSRDTSSATISIQNSPTTNTSVNPNLNF